MKPREIPQLDPWPRSYLAFDLETTGLRPGEAYTIEIGHAVVIDGELVDVDSFRLNWALLPEIDADDFRRSVDRVHSIMISKGKPFELDFAEVERTGVDPIEALGFYGQLLEDNPDMPIVGHNAIGFDIPHLREAYLAFDTESPFDSRLMIDTYTIERAVQLTDAEIARVRKYDPKTFLHFHEVQATIRRKGLTGSLDTHCANKYRFSELGVDPASMHGAETDALCCHLLMGIYGKIR